MDNKSHSQLPVPGSSRMIFLVGMPAAGKTYWGNKIAKEFKLPFIDLDAFIAEQEQASVSALFAMYGENGFREREQKYLRKIISTVTGGIVIACGGGTPCFGDNMQQMRHAGTVIYLQANVAWLLHNIKNGDEVRPLLNNRGDLGLYLLDMLNKRKRFYELAHHILQAKDISLTTFTKIITYV